MKHPRSRLRRRRLSTRRKAVLRTEILLKADATPDGPGWNDEALADGLEVGRATVERVRKEVVEEGLEAALERRKPRRLYLRKLDGAGEAHRVAWACQKPPDGRRRWTLKLLADRMVELEYVDQISYQTGRRTLNKTRSSLG